ncbi:MAG: GGDEF domain-containing protein [Solirubrobacteraceae bacterium]|nr:GGDEF domain-containing protein [Solirubrobacteraceae bacterium]
MFPQATTSEPSGRRDTPAQLVMMKWVAATMFIVGGCTSATGVLITQTTSQAKVAQGVGAAVLVLIGLVVLVTAPRRRVIEAAMLTSIAILGVSMAMLNPVGMMPFFFLWPIVYAAYFCSTRMLVTAFSLMVVAVGAGVAASPHIATKLDTFEGTVVSVGLMGALVAVMQRRERDLRRELEDAARTDPLTGLLNRRGLGPSLTQHLADAVHAQSSLSLVMLDLDHFKRFNDTHGHLEGDIALQRLAAVLRAEAGPRDLVSRFGGEEFAVVLRRSGPADALAYARGVAARLAREQIDESMRLSVSCGICSADLDPEASVDVLVARADEALYAAKAAGRRRAAWWTADGLVIDGDAFATLRAAA